MTGEPTLITSVIRALHLLELVADEHRPVTAKRLAHLSGIALPTTYHLLRTLVHEGYLTRTDDGYIVGDVPARLAGGQEHGPVPRRVHQVMRTLHEDLKAPAYLAAYRDGEVDLLDIVDSPTAPRVDLWVGLQHSAHATALGKAVMSGLTHDDLIDYLTTHPMYDLTHRTRTTVRSLLVDLDEAGPLVVDREEYALGTTCIAVPITAGDVTASLAVSVPSAAADRVLQDPAPLRRAAQLVELAYAS